MEPKKFFNSKTFKTTLSLIIGLIVLLLVFYAGIIVGFKKADFSFQWGENYHRNFGGPQRGVFGDFRGNDFIDAYGVFGQIIKIDNSTLVIKGSDNVEKIVLIKNDTVINRFRDNIKISDLQINDSIVVIGQPNNQGQIEAKLIRLLPPGNPGLPYNNPPMPINPPSSSPQ
jgi:hypothetical protein